MRSPLTVEDWQKIWERIRHSGLIEDISGGFSRYFWYQDEKYTWVTLWPSSRRRILAKNKLAFVVFLLRKNLEYGRYGNLQTGFLNGRLKILLENGLQRKGGKNFTPLPRGEGV
jgi:hypothetical protein